jgi:hypothetical protein
MGASANGRVSVCELLLNRGADMNLENDVCYRLICCMLYLL